MHRSCLFNHLVGLGKQRGWQVEAEDLRRRKLSTSVKRAGIAICSLFDHLVSASEQRRRHVEAERLRRLEVDHQLELGWLLNR